MTDWIGILHDNDGTRGWVFPGAGPARALDAAGCEDAARRMDPARVIRAGHPDAPAEPLPAPLCPATLPVGPAGRLLPRLTQTAPRHETDGARLAAIGFLAMNPAWDGTLCLPGPVTHWLSVSAGEVVFLGGSLTLAMADASDAPDLEALSDTLSRPERLAGQLRSAGLQAAPGVALGHLLGAEMAATRALWLGTQVAIIGQAPGTRAYLAALEGQFVPVTRAPLDAMSEKGMRALGAMAGLAG